VTTTDRDVRDGGAPPRTADWRFLRSPRWLAGHALCLVLVVLFANLGFWQLRRLDERRTFNAVLAERLVAAPVDLDAAMAEVAEGGLDAVAFRPATARGTYRAPDEVLVGPLSRDGQPGFEVLTPMDTTSGQVLWVNRGWVPFAHDDPPVAAAAPAGGEVVVTGLLREPLATGGQGSARPDGTLRLVTRPDLDLLAPQAGGPALPVWLQRTGQTPTDPGGLPLAQPPPAIDEGSHAAYAGQWFIFATVGLVGYPLLLARVARDRRRGPAGADQPTSVP
jgi:surfeit locus 1 family protein